MDNTPKTAMMELVEKYKALPKSSNEWTNGLIRAFIKDATELLEKEKTQIELAAIWGANYAIDNLGNAVADSGKAFETYFNSTYKQ